MKLLPTTATICLAVLLYVSTAEAIPQCTRDGLIYEADLDTGFRPLDMSPRHGFSVLEDGFLPGQGECSWEGRVMITFPAPAVSGTQNRALGFRFTHATSSNGVGTPSFHIGDSIVNNGLDIPSSLTSHSAEIFNDGLTLKVHANREPNRPTVSPYKQEPNFIDPAQVTDIQVGHQFILAKKGTSQPKYYQDYLFSLNGDQPQTGVPDYKVYLGMNRLIKQRYPQAKGLCSVKIYALTCTNLS